jgi:peptidoglycan-N-acetylglucosamine deacetylase
MLLKTLLLSFFTIANTCALAQTVHRQVAITIDDLPYADGERCDETETLATTEKLLDPIRAANVPVVGFVIGDRCMDLKPGQRRILLKMWLDAGAELGNHTWSHPDLNQIHLKEYEKQILETDDDLRRTVNPSKLRYFRAPYLHDGTNLQTKKQLQRFLSWHGYQEAPVTFDNNDWTFAAAYGRALKNNDSALAKSIEDAYIPYMESIADFFEKRSVEVLGRECPQVLLIHASRLNAKMMPALLQMLKERGYTFVSLEQAMRDDSYRIPDTYIGRKGLSWIHRWGLAKGKPIKPEPNEPEWVAKIANQPVP